ncbi:MAG: D-alanyl-D-alanine carboxypeptidase/D-alanyl-D-alanine-endopeptidase [marine benthic group bacterium]|nr:D-alanyl-D-alanine carboxypeptidase/D-alanyl-D-alanine-endopeptidase [Gemmatimonadota bacterium]
MKRSESNRGRPVRLLAIAVVLPLLAPGSVLSGQEPAVIGNASHSAPASVSKDDLAERLRRIVSDPVLTRAHVGLAVQVAETGEVLFENEAEKRFVPASNTKIVTAAVALDALGPDYRWTTRLVADGTVRDGVLAGDLWIVGGGDPLLSRSDLAGWIPLIREAGIRQIEGDLVGDDRVFEAGQWGEGWMWDDLFGGWAAGVSGLQLHPNTVRAWLIPGTNLGDPARVELRGASPALPIDNRVRTGAPGSEVRLRFLPPPEGGDVRLEGWVPVGPDSVPLYLSTPHPTLYLLDYLRERLQSEGIAVIGVVRRADPEERPSSPGWSTDLRSEPLSEVIADMLKPSDNQIAETVLRTVGREAGDGGSAESGIEVVDETLAVWGIDPGAVSLADGSGLSRYNEVTPNAMVRLLRAMWRHPEFPIFESAMPVAGVDGTLRRRLLGTPGESNVRAKTGSLSSVRALSGYLRDGAGETLIFSLILNGYDAPGDVAVALEDLLVEQLALFRRPVAPGWPEYRNVP